MSKFIDAEKLIVEIKKRAKFHDDAMKACTGLNTISITHSAGWIEDTELLAVIDSLQQERPSLPSNLDEAAKEYDEAESWSYEALPYPRRAAFIEGAKWMARQMKQEKPEVDLEKEIDNVIADYSFTKTIDSGGFKTTVLDYAKIARHFYELGLKARKEE